MRPPPTSAPLRPAGEAQVCERCHLPLTPNFLILEDARRRGITITFLPLRCAHGHTARLELPRARMRFVPTCGYCGEIVLDRGASGKQLLNHPACARALLHTSTPARPHEYVEIEA